MSTYKANLWKILAFRFCIHLHFVGAVLVPFFTDWGKLTFTQIMMLQSWFMLWIFLLEVPTGAVADYLGRKHSMILGCILNAIGILVYTSTPHFFVFLIAEFIWAASDCFISGANEAFIYDTLRELDSTKQSKKFFGRSESIGLVGLVISAPLGSLIAAHFGVKAPMFLMFIPQLIAALIGFTFTEPKIGKKRESDTYKKILKDGLKFFYKHKILKILALDMIAIHTVAYFMIWFYQLILKKIEVPIGYFGLVGAAYVLCQIFIIENYERLEKILGSKKRLLFISALVTGFMFIISALTTYIPIVIAAIIGAAGIGLARRPLLLNYMNKYIPSEQRATIISTIAMLRTLVLVILNPLVGLLTEWSLNKTLIILGTLAICFAFISKIEENHLID